MIFGNQNANQDETVEPSGSPAAGSFLVGGAASDAATTDAPLPADIDDDTSAPSGTLDQPVASATDDDQSGSTDNAAPIEPDSLEHSQDEFSSIIAPADRDVPAVVHASVKSSLINDRSNYDDDTEDTPVTHSAAQDVPDDLLELKQQALGDLGPLVDHLDQTPEEKFRTTMMLIQSTDNSTLIKDAYAAAQAITDDKIRAQALLDVVNEINYFTQQPEETQE
jgi:hypothetical protein